MVQAVGGRLSQSVTRPPRRLGYRHARHGGGTGPLPPGIGENNVLTIVFRKIVTAKMVRKILILGSLLTV